MCSSDLVCIRRVDALPASYTTGQNAAVRIRSQGLLYRFRLPPGFHHRRLSVGAQTVLLPCQRFCVMIVSKFIKAYSAVFVKENPENEKEGGFSGFSRTVGRCLQRLIRAYVRASGQDAAVHAPQSGDAEVSPLFFLIRRVPAPAGTVPPPLGAAQYTG